MDHRILMLCGHKPASKAGAVHWNGIWLRCGACQAELSAQKAKPAPGATGVGFYHHEEGAK
jgi:hypothetical protein